MISYPAEDIRPLHDTTLETSSSTDVERAQFFHPSTRVFVSHFEPLLFPGTSPWSKDINPSLLGTRLAFWSGSALLRQRSPNNPTQTTLCMPSKYRFEEAAMHCPRRSSEKKGCEHGKQAKMGVGGGVNKPFSPSLRAAPVVEEGVLCP